jgi:hypothetical protein
MLKKIIGIIILATTVASAQTISTPNIGLLEPAAGSTNWNLPLNYNFNLLDQLIGATLQSVGVGLSLKPVFGTGSPTISCTPTNQGQQYFDTSTSPFTGYVCNNSSWSGTGSSSTGGPFPNGLVYGLSPGAARSALASDISSLLSPLTNCSSANYVYSPANGNCILASGIALGSNTAVATKGDGTLSNLPEVQTVTTGSTTSIACQEDHSNGIFDPRCTTYSGGVGGSTPALAWQSVFDAAACWTSIQGNNQRAATINMPPGIWPVGTPASPTLTGAPGVNYVGSNTGSPYGSVNMGGTYFLATYSHVGILSIPSPYYVACSGDTLINVTSASINSSNVLTLVGTNTAVVGQVAYITGLTGTGLTQLNGSTLTITAANSSQIQLGATAAAVAPTAQSGATAQPKHISADSGGSIGGIAVGGCNNISCLLPPGDNGSHPEYQANEIGIFIGLTHTNQIGSLSASNTGGPGIRISGLDVVAQGPFIAYKTATYWLGSPSGYNPATDGLHGQIEFLSGDSRFFHFETYGDFTDPGTTYGHRCGVVLGGGNTYMSDGFIQLEPIGACTNDTGHRISDVRFDGMRGADILDNGFSNIWSDMYMDGFCLSATARTHPTFDPTGPGICDAIIPGGAGISTFSNIFTQRGFFDGETFKGTGDILQGNGYAGKSLLSIDTGSDLQIDNTYDGIGGNNLGENVASLPLDQAVYNGKGNVLTGTTPSVFGHRHIEMQNTTVTNITDLQNAVLQVDYKIALDSKNDVLVSSLNGGNFYTCDGYNVVGPSLVDFTSIQTKLSTVGGNKFLETCAGVNKDYWQINVPNNTFPATNSLSSLNVFGAAAVNSTAPLANGTFSQAGAASSFTYNWVTEVYVAGGKQTNTPQSTSNTPLAVQTSMNNIYYHQYIPLNWTEYKIILQSTTDPSFTPGTYYDVTAPTAVPQPAIADINLPLTVLTPLNTNVLLTTNYGVNMTGTFVFDPTNIPSHSTTPCMPGQIKLDVTGGYEYYCVSEDTWKRAPLTFSTF